MVVSIVALVLSVAGTSVAGVATISVLNKKEKKQTRNIAKDEINRAAPGLTVAAAARAQNATNAQNAVNAENATNAQNAQTVPDDSITGAKVLAGSLSLSDSARSAASNMSGAMVAAGACNDLNFGFAALELQPGDVGFLVPELSVNGIVPHSPAQAGAGGTLLLGVCNVSNGPITLPSPYPLRIYAFHP